MTRGEKVVATALALAIIVLGSAWPRPGSGVPAPDAARARLDAPAGTELDAETTRALQAVLAAMLDLDRYALDGEPDARLASRAVYRLCRLLGEDAITQRQLRQRVDRLFPACTLPALDPAAAQDCIVVRGETIELSGAPAAPELTVLTCAETADGLRLRCHIRLGETEAEARVLLQDGKIAGALLL